MSAQAVSYCINRCGRKQSYWVYVGLLGVPFCKKCWDEATQIHQLSIPDEVVKAIKKAIKKDLKKG
jgi:hypothetical protein